MPAPSLWLAEVDRARRRSTVSTRLPATADVVVVGGGIMGVSVAYWLSRLGAQVLLLESRLLGWGASGRNGGLLLAGASSLEDPTAVRDLLEEEGIDADYEQPGHLALATSPEMIDSIRAEIACRTPAAAPLVLLDRDGCEQVLGLRMSPRFLGGRWLPRGALINPVRLLQGLAAAAVRRSAVVATRTPVLRVDGTTVHTTRGAVHAENVVLACGSRTGRLAPVLARALTPLRGQMLATAPMRRIFGVGLALDRGTVYWRQATSGEVVVGGLRDRDPAVERTGHEALNQRIQSALTQFLPEAFPGLEPIRVRWRWSGTMDETPDGRPLIGAVPGSPGQWAIAGFGGHGLPPALGAGRALAGSVMSGVVADVLARYVPARLVVENAAL
jgi:gamma-glutamylputrescine oxidase